MKDLNRHTSPDPMDHPITPPPKPSDARRSVTPVWMIPEKVIGEAKLEISDDGVLVLEAKINDEKVYTFLANLEKQSQDDSNV